eukprot:TRINITY_DN8751_c0_g1_i3.p1 TRINITY_DN8751_c0_g1~~TRINITY_DN8751_c0_g1_i3.p1  ORF type:complete len:190 (-),score=6.35 TRINITY_DN8751_c0_g1_i3:177-746(-)
MVNSENRVPEICITSPLHDSTYSEQPSIVLTSTYNADSTTDDIFNSENQDRHLLIPNANTLYPDELYRLASHTTSQPHIDLVNTFIKDRLADIESRQQQRETDHGYPSSQTLTGCSTNCPYPDIKRNLDELLTCPVCYSGITDSVQQCQYGHVICQQCKGRLRRCPVCRTSISFPIRNLTIEKVARLMR